MNAVANLNSIDVKERLSSADFFQNYVTPRKPVLLKGGVAHLAACEKWDQDYFRKIGESKRIHAKIGGVENGKIKDCTIGEYLDILNASEQDILSGNTDRRPPYWHDYPVFKLIPSLIKDTEGFPKEYLHEWYQEDWYKYVQFFMGGVNSFTPLHFDTLYTHNLFFQIHGRKRFYLIDAKYKEQCYVYNWRWAEVNVAQPDLQKHPRFKGVECQVVDLDPGDILYIPAGTLHEVHGLSYSISFNIDWHTKDSVVDGLYGTLQGAPMKNAYYNFLLLLGVRLGIPSKRILPFYKTYLNYIS